MSKLVGGLARVRSTPVRTARAEFEQLLRRKSAWLQDLEKHPLCVGVPLGRNGGPDKSISVDLGLKNMAQISTRELAASSSQYKQALIDRIKGGPLEGQPEDLRRAEPIPMAVIVKEDVQRLPVATPARTPSAPVQPSLFHSHPRRTTIADAQEQPGSAHAQRGFAGLTGSLLQRRACVS